MPSEGNTLFGNIPEGNLSLERTERFSHFGEDFVILDNPSYTYLDRKPYKMDRVAAIFCSRGQAEGTVNFTPYSLRPGGMLVVLSGHIVESLSVSEDFSGTHIFMSSKFLRSLDIGDSYKFYEAIERNPYIQLDDRAAESIGNYFSMCHSMQEYNNENPNTEEALRLLTKLIYLMMGWFIHRDAFSEEVESRGSDTVGQFLSLVKRNYRKHRDVAFYAGEMNMTAKYLSAVIKKTSGRGPLELIESYVILDAKAQLGSTTDTIEQIAYSLNFPTQSFFGRYFKRSTGMSPSEYRSSVRMHGENR
ncbi:MAG: AraC family transcriptional regulator [Bacteroidales bacterium]|nr:AraC family transcriptional regulator [Bacteroidales bacterium]